MTAKDLYIPASYCHVLFFFHMSGSRSSVFMRHPTEQYIHSRRFSTVIHPDNFQRTLQSPGGLGTDYNTSMTTSRIINEAKNCERQEKKRRRNRLAQRKSRQLCKAKIAEGERNKDHVQKLQPALKACVKKLIQHHVNLDQQTLWTTPTHGHAEMLLQLPAQPSSVFQMEEVLAGITALWATEADVTDLEFLLAAGGFNVDHNSPPHLPSADYTAEDFTNGHMTHSDTSFE
ncbi:hypothetical protein K470DRAFT_90780 [Piedraia hortae CBS 480.64]|uniref:BZIP domain-containing protein n=1 Tax=Piedraia hortae CBS 480.64 TaxID=1314780 RepID=A0A6A7BXK5_9PEZI|nr:hypothetical protein K470DRAFT_90780 [Piedraia hortae CBS 480.64]